MTLTLWVEKLSDITIGSKMHGPNGQQQTVQSVRFTGKKKIESRGPSWGSSARKAMTYEATVTAE